MLTVKGLIPQSTRHEIASVDVQGSADDMIVLVTGRVFVSVRQDAARANTLTGVQYQLDGGNDPLYFSEAFHLKTASPGRTDTLWIFRDIIRVTKLQ